MKTDDASLLAYVDGELSPQDTAQIEQAIGASEELSARVALLRASQLPYGEAFGQQSLPPVPESLTRNVEAMIRRHREAEAAASAAAAPAGTEEPEASLGPNVHRLRPRAPKPAAFTWPKLAVAFVAGAFCCGLALQFLPTLRESAGLATVASQGGMAPWIRAAAGYQQLYVRDTIASLQPDAAATAATVADIQSADHLPVRIPDLSSEGLTFKRVQRLRFHDKPLVQIVYLPKQGKPVALCVLRVAKGDAAPSSQQVDGMSVVAWRRGELGYALIAAPGDVDLEGLGKQLYDGPAPATIGSAEVAAPAPRA
ncbi:anti-sigma factor family protein [Burkholderia sp. Ac-20379]|uniref:anti-sigma factor family protein n=1 Tax=Burkholderia sp. Ac-20379 TaxID=2703900 RepID=UPI00197E0410|nr:anti-sigma factor [Burkholderia sp. Ac-20379]MBN3728246.1 anti-sigma factor [Burkholderia sp. Ac-20379]